MTTTALFAVMSPSHALSGERPHAAERKAPGRITLPIALIHRPGAVAAVNGPEGRTANTTAMVRT